MIIAEPVTVGLINNRPKYMIWKGRSYKITQIGLHHTLRKGLTLYHIYSVVAGSIFLRLKLNTENLTWKLEEITDATLF